MREVPVDLGEKLAPAAAVFAERGFERTRVEDLAKATGIPKATLYYYFNGKEEVLAYLLEAMLAKVAGAVWGVSASAGTARQRLVRVVKAQLAAMAEHPEVCQALISELGRAGRIPEIAAAVEDAFYNPVRQLLSEGAIDGSLRHVHDREAVASAIFGAITVTGLHYLVADGHLPHARVARIVASLLIDGLKED